LDNTEKIMIIEDDQLLSETIEVRLAPIGYDVLKVFEGEKAIELLKKTKKNELNISLVILDIKFIGQGRFCGDLAGVEILREIKKELRLDIPVIVITAFPDTKIDGMSIGARVLELGAEDYLEKPFNLEELKIVVKRSIEKHKLFKESQKTREILEYYKSSQSEKYHFGSMVGESKKMQQVYGLIKKIAPQKTPVLITGETGTGKELVAYAIHHHSPRSKGPFIILNCAAILKTTLENELFGVIANYPGFHNKEALTGKFELADGGTIFFDEIGDMDIELQAKVLRVLEDKKVTRLGDEKTKEVDVRVLCATNKDLKSEMQQNHFRQDLFQRINVFPITLPPLRERKEDINSLVDHFIERHAKETKKNVSDISPDAKSLLLQYDYPGNIRELENIIERAVILSDEKTIPSDIVKMVVPFQPEEKCSTIEELTNLSVAKEKFEKEYILSALTKSNGNIARASKLAGIDRSNFKAKMNKYGIEKPGSK